MKILILTALLLQSLPTYGPLSGLRDARRVYVTSENEDSRKRVVKALGKEFEVVNSPDDAEFFVEFNELSREATTTGHVKEREQRSQMRVYMLDIDRRQVIVWADTIARETEHMLGIRMYDSGRGEEQLTSKFLKALKKAREGKK